MIFRKPLVAGIAVAALMLSPLSAYAQDAAPAEAPAAEAPADAPAATDATAPADAAAAGSQNWLKVCDPLPDGQKACIMRQVVLANGQFLG
jgi:invasion protein IalB